MKWLLVALCLALFAPRAEAAVHGIAIASCPHGTGFSGGTLGTDGCAEALAYGGSFRFANMSAYLAGVQESNQLWFGQSLTQVSNGLQHPQPFNIVGPDFSTGPNALSSGTVDNLGSLVPGCVYNPTRHGAGRPGVICSGSTANISMLAWDFHDVAGNCVTLEANASETGSWSFLGNRFKSGATCNGLPLITFTRGSGNVLTFKHNEVDGNCIQAGSGTSLQTQQQEFVDASSATAPLATIEFNNLHGMCGRGGGLGGQNYVIAYNAEWDWCKLCSQNGNGADTRVGYFNGTGTHGEFWQLITPANTSPTSVIVDYNLVSVPATPYVCCTSLVLQTAGFQGTNVGYLEIDYNTIVGNAVIGGGSSISASIVEFESTAIGTFQEHGNYVDVSGGTPVAGIYQCTILGGAGRLFTSSVGTGANSNILTVTSAGSGASPTGSPPYTTVGTGSIALGAVLYGTGFPVGGQYPSVLSYGTATLQNPYLDGSGGNTGGTFTLNSAAFAGIVSTNSMVATTAITTIDLGTGGTPAQGGTQNVSLLGGDALSGYQIINNSGNPQVCH